MTYGWALVLIATVVGALVFVFGFSDAGQGFSPSDAAKFAVKGSAVSEDSVRIKMVNVTGGQIVVSDIFVAGGFDCSLNGVSFSSGSGEVAVGAGGELDLVCSNVDSGEVAVLLEYADFAGLEHSVAVGNSVVSCPLNKECIADITFDGKVDVDDYSMLTDFWDQKCNSENFWCEGTDLTCDGTVNSDDYTLWASSYGPC
jgi:hypothetical protein